MTLLSRYYPVSVQSHSLIALVLGGNILDDNRVVRIVGNGLYVGVCGRLRTREL